MKKRILGSSGLEVSAIGLGCWGMSGAYGRGDRKASIETVHLSIDQGINFIDTADIYGNGHNEILVGEAIKGHRKDLVLATKFGFVGGEDGDLTIDGRPEYVRKACEASLKRLGTDYIDLYYLHRLDSEVPVEETVGAMSKLVEEGKVRFIGLSEVSAATLDRAASVHPLAALQSEYSLTTRDIENDIIPSCRKNKVAIVPFSPLGRGLLTLSITSEDDLPDNDFRRELPRFRDDNLKNNLDLLSLIKEISLVKNATPAQIALAWLLHRGDDIIPIPGMKRPGRVKENISSVYLSLSSDEIESLDTIYVKIRGARYNEKSSRFLE